MNSTTRTNSILTITGLTVLGLVAYAVYFDYKRRNDPQFRKKLKKEKKRVDKSIASSKASLASSSASISKDALRAALDQIKSEDISVVPEQREAYFMSQVGLGEQLAARGEEFYLPAAMSFFRALRVYPSPVELMVIYEKTVPPPIFNLVMELTNLDAKDKLEDFYNQFPPKSYNVSIVVDPETKGKRTVIVDKDFKAGETIYKEKPVVTALDVDVQAAGSHCSHCLRVIESSIVIKTPQDPLASVYCSKSCQAAAKAESHTLLFSLERVLPDVIPIAPTPEELETRRKAQTQFADYIKKHSKVGPLLLARFIARRLIDGMNKMIPGTSSTTPEYADAENGEYSLDDHIERLRYIEVAAPEESILLLTSLITSALPTMQSYLPDEQLKMLLGKMAYNGYGVCHGDDGRDNRPVEDSELTRSPYGTARQIGTAFYTLSSYLNHSCVPSARPSFSNGTAELHIIATRDLKKGEELTVAYVNVNQGPDESVQECRKRRRAELTKGWKFACLCTRCQEEGDGNEDVEKDDSKVQDAVKRWETAAN